MLKYLGRLGAAVAAAWLALAPASIVAAGPAWEQWQTVKGIFEVKDGVLTISHGSENGDRPTGFDDPRGITRTFKRDGR